MRAVQYVEHGGPEVLHVVGVEEPHAGPGQVRVEVKAVGVNPVDWKLRQGLLPAPLPRIPGSDVAGVMDEIGAGVSGVSLADAVFGFTVGGGYAQYAVLEHFAAKPAAMSFEEAAAIPVPAAVRVLDLLGVAAGDTLLINAATGGVGTAAVQLARARAAHRDRYCERGEPRIPAFAAGHAHHLRRGTDRPGTPARPTRGRLRVRRGRTRCASSRPPAMIFNWLRSGSGHIHSSPRSMRAMSRPRCSRRLAQLPVRYPNDPSPAFLLSLAAGEGQALAPLLLLAAALGEDEGDLEVYEPRDPAARRTRRSSPGPRYTVPVSCRSWKPASPRLKRSSCSTRWSRGRGWGNEH
jgi:hypothetical protein